MSNQPRILVVDDEPQLTRVLRTGLKSRGYDVRAAADGLAGFEAFNDWHPDLVITDLAMPNVDGLELCRRLRAVSQVPIIVLSAKGEEKTKVEALDLGADDFITKPFGIDELLARVRASLRRAKTPPMNEATQTTLALPAPQARKRWGSARNACPPGGSTSTTSAPKSARIRPAIAAGSPARSTTRVPARSASLMVTCTS